MELAEALRLVAEPETDAGRSYEALRLIGRHLAKDLEFPPGTVAVAIGRDALDLLAGACEALGEMTTYSVVGRRADGSHSEVVLSWITGRPPTGVPLVVFDRSISTGATLRAVLDDLSGTVDQAHVTALVVDANPDGVHGIVRAHPDVRIATVTDPLLQPDGVEPD